MLRVDNYGKGVSRHPWFWK